MKTKIWYGNQYVKSVDLNRKYDWKFFKTLFKLLLKRSAWACVLAWMLMGAFKTGQMLYPHVVYAEKQVPVVQPTEFPPILQKICNAESGGQQFLKNGHVVRGHVTPSDIGYCQINETIWNDKARDLGYDIYTEDGNKNMAIWIFLHYGTDPWNSSKSMWSK